MDPYGPYTLVAGTPQRVNLGAGGGFYTAVRVLNNSGLTLNVAFTGTGSVPGPTDFVVLPKGREPQSVPANWDGGLWLSPVNAGGLSTSGTSSALAQATIEGYYQGETPPQATAVGSSFDLSSQPRVVSIPVIPHVKGNFSAGYTLLGAVHGVQLVTIASFGALASPATMTVYLYSMLCGLSGTRRVSVQVYVGSSTGALPTLANSAYLVSFDAWAGTAPGPLFPHGAWATQLTVPAGMTGLYVWAYLDALQPAGTTANLYGNVNADVDQTGQVPPPSIGNGAATPGGVLY